jgi:hypothetical protein
VGFTIEVASLERLRRLLASNNVSAIDAGIGSVAVPAQEAGGCVIEFRQAQGAAEAAR